VAAVAVAVAAAAADPWLSTYQQVYKAAYSAARKAIDDKYGPVIAQVEDSALGLYAAMIRPVAPQ
jgi:hypothetical protein